MMKLFTCPWCHGDGGDYDPVLYYGAGGGPWEECFMCKGKGKVGLWIFLLSLKWKLLG